MQVQGEALLEEEEQAQGASHGAGAGGPWVRLLARKRRQEAGEGRVTTAPLKFTQEPAQMVNTGEALEWGDGRAHSDPQERR